MPVLESVPAEADLAQGDLLNGLEFHYSTIADGRPAKQNGVWHGLVISRDCAALNRDVVLIAQVQVMTQNPFEGLRSGDGEANEDAAATFFEDARSMMSSLRDGSLEPDRFYLGGLAGKPGRFVAQLDLITPFRVPPNDQLSAWVKEHRLGRLSPDFLRALPVRVHGSIARVGFDDHDWYSNEDLELLVLAGRAAIAKTDAAIAARSTKRAVLGATKGDPHESKQESKLQEAALAKRTRLAEQLKPLSDELERRLGSAGQSTFLPDVTQKAAEKGPPAPKVD
jgi:hypothetical protein